MLDTTIFAEEVFSFHVQQAVEKALKAWLAILGIVYPFTHDLSVLLQQLENQGCQVDNYWNFLEFTPYAVKFRYGFVDVEDVLIDREADISKVEQLLKTVEAFISQEKE